MKIHIVVFWVMKVCYSMIGINISDEKTASIFREESTI
jgi:hypothetical protein